MVKLYLGSCDELSSREVIYGVCDFFTRNLNRDDLLIYAPLGIQNGDIICRNYAVSRNIKHIFLKPREMSQKEIMEQCDYAIVFNSHRNTDAGHANGVDATLGDMGRYIKTKIVEVHLNYNGITIHDCAQRVLPPKERKQPIEALYEFAKNGDIIIRKQESVIREYKKKHNI